jgi:type II secretory pathway component PulK
MNFLFRNNISLSMRNQKGSILILVLFALMTLSLLAFSVGYTVRQKLSVVTRLESREKLRLAAQAAVSQASVLLSEKIGQAKGSYQSLNQSWAKNEPLWKQAKIGSVDYSVLARGSTGDPEAVYGLIDENSKINLNTAQPVVLHALFQGVTDLDNEGARRIVAANGASKA